MNKIIESVNFASDSYWGDPERFKFRAAIDNYTTTAELVDGGDRTVKTSFQIKIAGYIVSDAINTSVANPNKFFSKAALKFGIEMAGSSEMLQAKAGTPAKQAPTRFFDTALTGVTGGGGMTVEQITYVGLNTTATADELTAGIAIFNNHTIATPPEGFVITQENFQVYVNGVLIPTVNRTVTQVLNNIEITFTSLEYNLDSQDQIILVGKFI